MTARKRQPEEVREGPAYQGSLFDADAVEKENRIALGKKRVVTSNRGKVTKVRDDMLAKSTIPTSHLQPRPPMVPAHPDEGPPETKMVFGRGEYVPSKVIPNRTLDVEAYRRGEKNKYKIGPPTVQGDVINMPSTEWNPVGVAVHEMGHRHHFSQFPNRNAKGIASPDEGMGTSRTDPLWEGIADAYVDRHLRGNIQAARTPRGIESTGYSTNFGGKRGWTQVGRALYGAVRAHYGATGEIPRYQPTAASAAEVRGIAWDEEGQGPDPTRDATLHHMLTHSTHARAALETLTTSEGKQEIPLMPVAEAASRRHMDRELLRQGQYVQDDLFGDPTMSRNQFGEVPRSKEDVVKSLSLNPDTLDPSSTNVAPNRRIGRRGLT
jgi:hypothetical protein